MDEVSRWIELTSHSVEQTLAVGRALAHICVPGDVVALDGELGAGKTQLVRGLVIGAGGDGAQVSSPTYVLMQEYRTGGRVVVLHLDAYRLEHVDELETTGWDRPARESAISLIEWADRIASELPADCLVIDLAHLAEHSRRIRLLAGDRRHALVDALEGEGLQLDSDPIRESAGRCPVCSKTTRSDAEHFPFCSTRCKMADLNRWFGGDYRMSRPLDWAEDLDTD